MSTGGGDGVSGGLVAVDKPAGMTSHDVVARVRRLGRTRRVGHGGTLDPMATGLLVIAVGRATRLLTYVTGVDKRYTATIRLGQSTVTDDAEGEVTASTPAGHLTDAAIRSALAALTGEIDQVPSAVSAIKVDGRRAYKRVRAGEDVVLPARRVTVSRLDVLEIRRPGPDVVDVDVDVVCSAGTYVRAIARDAGNNLAVGGHLTALRRTAVGRIGLDEAVTLGQLEERAPDLVSLPVAAAARRFLPARDVREPEARLLSHGGPIEPIGIAGPYAVFSPAGEVIAVVSERGGRARAEVVLAPAGQE